MISVLGLLLTYVECSSFFLSNTSTSFFSKCILLVLLFAVFVLWWVLTPENTAPRDMSHLLPFLLFFGSAALLSLKNVTFYLLGQDFKPLLSTNLFLFHSVYMITVWVLGQEDLRHETKVHMVSDTLVPSVFHMFTALEQLKKDTKLRKTH